MKTQQTQQMMQFVPIIIMFVIFYFLLIRPQKKQQNERKLMLDSLKVGDKVLTTGGIYGTITKVSEKSLRVKIAAQTEIRISRAGVAQKTSKDDEE